MHVRECLLLSGTSLFLVPSPADAIPKEGLEKPEEMAVPDNRRSTYDSTSILSSRSSTAKGRSTPPPLSSPEPFAAKFSTPTGRPNSARQASNSNKIAQERANITNEVAHQISVKTCLVSPPERLPTKRSCSPRHFVNSGSRTAIQGASPAISKPTLEQPTHRSQESVIKPEAFVVPTYTVQDNDNITVPKRQTPSFNLDESNLDEFAAPPEADIDIAEVTNPKIESAEPGKLLERRQQENLAPVPEQPVETIDSDLLEGGMEQITPVSQFLDVKPTDWAFQALQSLQKKYGVIAGYPDKTFRGNRSLSRYEFAAILQPILDSLAQINTEGRVTQEELNTLKRLQDDFATELTELGSRINNLEAQVETLAGQQFSTTVKLSGEVLMAMSAATGGDPPGRGETNPILNTLTNLQLTSWFTERQRLQLGLVAGDFIGGGFVNPRSLNTKMALLSYQAGTGNSLVLGSLEYRILPTDRLGIIFKPVGFNLGTVLSTNSIFNSASQGALSRFAGSSPIFKLGSLGSGLGLDYMVTDRLRLQVAYGARNANSTRQGLVKSDHRALGIQLFSEPVDDKLRLGFAYVNVFSDNGQLDTLTGSNNADISGGFNEPATIHAVNGSLLWNITPTITFSTWGGAMLTQSHRSLTGTLSTTYQFGLGFADLFDRKGDLLGVIVGQPPRLRIGVGIPDFDRGSGLHYELFYRFRLNDRIAITPGVFMVTDPGHIAENNDIFVGAIRTSFTF